MESLNYALSCNSEHAGAHCLLGRLYAEQLKQFDKAEHHFEQALVSDMNYVDTYAYYSLLLITFSEYGRASKLLKYAYKVKGVSMCMLKHREALICESKKEYAPAKELMKLAFVYSINEREGNFLKVELERVKSKLNKGKKKKSKKSSKKKK
jgi:tetratricopeptide (TPR) repeat protein